jgi:hypothetical protein
MKYRFLAGILVLIVLAMVIGGALIWYKVATFKNQLAQNLGHALGAQVEVASLNLDFWKGELHAAGIVLTNDRSDAPWDHGEISQATIRFHWRDLLAPTLPLELEVDSWRVNLHSSASAAQEPPTAASDTTPPAAKSRIKVTQLSARDGEVEIDLAATRQVMLHGVAFESSNNGAEVWTTQLRATSINAGPLEVGTSSVEIRGETDKITFSDLRMQCADGIITGDGELGTGGLHETRAALKAVGVPVVMLVAVQWQMKLSGLADGALTYQGNDQGGQAQGQISIGQGKFNVLPFLGKMAAMVGLPDITGTEVDKATADFAWKDRALHLTNIDIRKNDVIRLAGQMDVDANSQVDGHLKVGLPDGTLAKWPQLQSTVFSVPFEDYGWADVHLTGTPDHLQEDLSSRVLAAGIQSGSGLINQGTQKAMDLLKGLMGP